MEFNPATDTDVLDKNLKFDSTVSQDARDAIRDLVIKYWCCFREEGFNIPVYGYEKVIDTGAAPPVNCKKIHYGLHESPIMQKTIDGLLAQDMIIEDTDSSWNSNIVLAPKPHQGHVTEIDNFIWRFCISYIGAQRAVA